MVFNAGLEAAFRGWANRLKTEGFVLSTKMKRLSDVRYAGDILLFGKTIEGIARVVEILVKEFAIVG